jgi:hypothetical protein
MTRQFILDYAISFFFDIFFRYAPNPIPILELDLELTRSDQKFTGIGIAQY